MRGDLNAGCRSHAHGQIFIFRQFWKIPALRFQDISAPSINDLETAFTEAQHRAELQLHALNGHFAGAADCLLPLLFGREFERRKGFQISVEQAQSSGRISRTFGQGFVSDRAAIQVTSRTVSEPTTSSPTISNC